MINKDIAITEIDNAYDSVWQAADWLENEDPQAAKIAIQAAKAELNAAEIFLDKYIAEKAESRRLRE
jgi:hypothetical protein